MPTIVTMTSDLVSLVNRDATIDNVKTIGDAVDDLYKKIDDHAAQAKKHERINRRVGQRKSLYERRLKWR